MDVSRLRTVFIQIPTKKHDLCWDFTEAYRNALNAPAAFCGINFINSNLEKLCAELHSYPRHLNIRVSILTLEAFFF